MVLRMSCSSLGKSQVKLQSLQCDSAPEDLCNDFELQQEEGLNLEKREESLQKYHIFSSEMTSLTFTNSNHRKYNNVLVFQPFRLFSTFYGFNLFKVTESKYVSSLILSLYNPFRFK